MHLSKLLIAELAAFRQKVGRDDLTILETGSIRAVEEQYHQNDGWSTLTFAEQVRDHGGKLYSIDLDVKAADEVLTRHEVCDHVELIEGDSVNVLADMLTAAEPPQLDVVLLDSDNNADLIMHEYALVKRLMRSPSLLLVDDVEPRSALVVKGQKLVPYLEAQGVPYRLELRTGDGYSTGVMVVNVA